jgi:hypothetical protein
MYYWEVIECIRRLLLTGAVVFIAPGTSAQAAVACVLAVVSLATALYCKPHAEKLDGAIYTIGALIVFLSMFLSLAMKADISKETSASQHAFAVVLVLLNIGMIVAALVQIVLVGHRAYLARQNSVLGIVKIDHSDDSDDVEEDATVATNSTDIGASLVAIIS